LSILNEFAGGTNPGDPSQGNHVLYEADSGDPQSPMGRAFAVTGNVDIEALARTAAGLRGAIKIFSAVHQSGIIIRIALTGGLGWNSPLLFPDGQPPRNIAPVREMLKDGDSITVLSYVIATLCDGMGWDASSVNIEESPIA